MENEKYIKLFNEILNCEDFELVRYKNGDFGLHDLQGANLGGIEEETFETMVQVLDRMEVYHIDYFENPTEEFYEVFEHNGYVDLVEKCRNLIDTNKEFEQEDKENWDLKALEFIGIAPNLEICNTPLKDIKGLFYKQLNYNNGEY